MHALTLNPMCLNPMRLRSLIRSYEFVCISSYPLFLLSEALGPIVFLQMLFLGLRTGLSVCQDYTFVAVAAVTTFILVYIPSILVARFVYTDSATAYFVAMYLPLPQP